jgi:hypothetical protein
MQIPIDEVYPYLQSCFPQSVIYRFWPHGSRDISNLAPLAAYTDQRICASPVIIAHDQEPLNARSYAVADNHMKKWLLNRGIDPVTAPDLNLAWSCWINGLSQRVLLHSDSNGPDLDWYRDHPAFAPVHFWSHAVIARDWFRYAEVDPELRGARDLQNLFTVYSRAWTGSREYRLSLLSEIKRHDLDKVSLIRFSAWDNHQHYHDHQFQDPRWSQIRHDLHEWCQPSAAPSTSSATYSAQDYRTSLFDLVPETVIDRVHVTEKTLRPIACGQPFLVMAGAGTLKYLRDHGFQTFQGLVDESYDQEQDHQARMAGVIRSMQQIQQRSQDAEWRRELESRANYNRDWFFARTIIKHIVRRTCDELESVLPALQKAHSTDHWALVDRARAQYRQNLTDKLVSWLPDRV